MRSTISFAGEGRAQDRAGRSVLNLGLGWRGILGIALAVAAILGIGLFAVLKTQDEARDDLIQRFSSRAESGARFTSSTVTQSAQSYIRRGTELLGDPRPTAAQMLQFSFVDGRHEAHTVVVDEDGDVVAAVPRSLARDRQYVDGRQFRIALQRGQPTMSDAFRLAGHPAIDFVVPFETAEGQRAATVPLRVSALDAFMERFLPRLATVPGTDAYLLDAQGHALGTAVDVAPGKRLPDPVLLAAVRSGNEGGAFDSGGQAMRFVSEPVPGTAGSRLVFVTPEANLYEPLADTQRLTWALFAGLALLVIAGTYLLLRSQARARALAVMEERLRDAATGLPTAALFLERLAESLDETRRGERGVGVVTLDVDRFKRVNDGLGQEMGDFVLARVGERIEGQLGEGELVARLGGDEFAVMLRGIPDRYEAERRIRTIREAVAAPITVDGHILSVTASVGAVLDTAGSQRADLLFDDAEAALTRAKVGGQPFAFFHPDVRERARERLELESDLREALAAGQIDVHYQPLVSLNRRRVTAVEALARWEHPERGEISPTVFIPVAEDSGLISELGRQVLDLATHQVAAWRDQGHELDLHVNLSVEQLGEEDLVLGVTETIMASGLAPDALCLELTETAMMLHSDIAVQRLNALKDVGVRIAIDDFGVGYSSLNQIAKQLPIDVIKIDRSFVATFDGMPESAIVEFVVSLCGALGLVSVAEGVETSEQASAVEELGCELAQGFFFARPQVAAEVERLLDGGLPVRV